MLYNSFGSPLQLGVVLVLFISYIRIKNVADAYL